MGIFRPPFAVQNQIKNDFWRLSDFFYSLKVVWIMALVVVKPLSSVFQLLVPVFQITIGWSELLWVIQILTTPLPPPYFYIYTVTALLQNSWDRTPGQDTRDRSPGTGHPGQDTRDRTGRVDQFLLGKPTWLNVYPPCFIGLTATKMFIHTGMFRPISIEIPFLMKNLEKIINILYVLVFSDFR
jgi:hypothetical protein